MPRLLAALVLTFAVTFGVYHMVAKTFRSAVASTVVETQARRQNHDQQLQTLLAQL